MKYLITAVTILGIMYMAIAFMELNIDFHLWSADARIAFAYWGIFFAAIGVIGTKIFEK